jgi:hypothetical protein
MSPEDDPVEVILRYLRGRGPRPAIDDPGVGALFELLEAIVDVHDGDEPPIGEDAVALRLGLVDRPDAADGAGPDGPDAIAVSLAELAHRLGGELTVEAASGAEGGALAVRAVCRTLGEVVLVLTVDGAGDGDGDGDELADLPRRVAGVFAGRPTTTAVAVVSTRSLLAVVVTEADCVRAIDPLQGWVEPALPRAPEPFGLALGRYLERSIPRWDRIARLDEMLVLAHEQDDLAATVARARHDRLERAVRIPAKRAALRALRALPSEHVVAVVNDVRAGRLHGDELLGRIRELSEVGAP